MVWRHRYEGGPQCAPLAWPGAHTAGGVAIGLTVVAQQVVPQYAEVVRAVVLCGTLIYELVGPGVAKWTLQKAGEIEPGQ